MHRFWLGNTSRRRHRLQMDIALAEIPESDAGGEVAEIYAQIRQTLAVPVVNFVWRHLATIDGGLAWAWPIVEGSRGLIDEVVPRLREEADRLIVVYGLSGGDGPTGAPPAALDVIGVYDRGNCWNMLSMSLLAAARAGHRIDPNCDDSFAIDIKSSAAPPFPRYCDLAPDIRRNIDRLAAAGPAAASGVRPSLWVHLANWPNFLSQVVEPYAKVLKSPEFNAAHAAFLGRGAELLSVEAKSPTPVAPPNEHAIDRAIRIFRLRIAEMVLIGRVLVRDHSVRNSSG